MAESPPALPGFFIKERVLMKTATRHFSQTNNGRTRTVMCVDRIGPDSVVLSSEFDMHNRLLRQVRFEHLHGCLANSVFTKFALNGRIEEQWVFLYDAEGRVTEQFGFDEAGEPLDHPSKVALAS
jgi:hypothetical protein